MFFEMEGAKLPGDLITITNYINPQLFWYANIKVVKYCATELKYTEQEIQKYYKGNVKARHTNGDLVVLNYLPIRKLIRGRVVEVHQSNPNVCTVWAIDYGFPIESSCEYMSSLPQQFEKSFNHIQCGGIGYVKLYDNLLSLQESSCFESMLVQAKSLRFNAMFEAPDGQQFGQLYIVEESKSYSAAAYLISKNLAIPTIDFESVCTMLPTTQYGSWRSMTGESLAIKNSTHVKDFKCETLSALVNIYTNNENIDQISLSPSPLQASAVPATTTDEVKSIAMNKTGWELPKKSPVSSELKYKSSFSPGNEQYYVTEASFDNGFNAVPSISKMLTSGKQTQWPFENVYTRYRQKIASLTDPSLQQDKIAEILQIFDRSDADSPTNVHQNSFRKLDQLLHKRTHTNGTSKTMDSPTSNNICEKKNQSVDEIAKKPIDDFSLKDAPNKTFDEEVNKIESKKEVIDRISLKATDKSIDKDLISKIESKMEDINRISKQHSGNGNEYPKTADIEKNCGNKPKGFDELHIKQPNSIIEKSNGFQEQNGLNGQMPMNENFTSSIGEIGSIDVSAKLKVKENKGQSTNEDILTTNKSSNYAGKKHIPVNENVSSLIDKSVSVQSCVKKGNSKDQMKNVATEAINNQSKPSNHSVGINDKANTINNGVQKMDNMPQHKRNGKNHRNRQRNGRKFSGNNGTATGNRNPNLNNGNHPKTTITKVNEELNKTESKKEHINEKAADVEVNCNNKKDPLEDLHIRAERELLRLSKQPNYIVEKNNECLIHPPKSIHYSIGIGDIANAINKIPQAVNNIPESNWNGNSYNRRFRYRNGRKNFETDPWNEDFYQSKTSLNEIDSKNNLTSSTVSAENIEKFNKIINEMQPLDGKPVNGERPLQINFMNHMVVAHANVPIVPVGNFDHIDFQANVRNVMKQRRIDKVLEIQKLAWPHLLHGNQSLILISQQKSGRTWSYLPTLCSQVEKQTNLELKKKQANKQIFGPMAIILVAGNKEAQNISSACETLLKNDISKATQVVAAYAGQNIADLLISMHNACKILVATTPLLEELFKYDATEKIFSPDRLSFVAIDDLDLITSYNGQQFKKIFSYLLKLCQFQRSRESLKPQLVLTSKHWQPEYMKLCWKHAKSPLLVFGDFLEASVFAQTRLMLNMVDTDHDKLQRAIDFLEYRTCNARTIIFCNECSEVLALQSKLENANYECLSYISTSGTEVLEDIKNWQFLPTKKILILSDECPEQKIIQNAKYLLHYSFAKTWIKFTRRFSSVTERFYKFAATIDVNQHKKDKSKKYFSLVLLNQKDQIWLPQIHKFMEKHSIQAPQPLESLMRKNKSKLEEERVVIGLTLCPMMATYAVCDEYNCIYRHELCSMDMVPADRRDEIPVDGDVTIEVLKVYNPAHFAVIVVKHQQPGASQSWRQLPNKENHISLAFKLIMHYSVEANNKMHWPPMQHDICVIKVGGQYQRVRILKVDQMANNQKVQPDVYVQIQVMDNNTDILQRKAVALLHCPLEFQKIPALAINVRIPGIVPFNGERTWLPNSAKMVTEKLQSIRNNKNMELFGQIDFTLSHTIFMKNIFVLENLIAAQTKTYTNLQTFLFKKEIAQKDETIVIKIRNIFIDFIQNDNDNNLNVTQSESLNESFATAFTSNSINELSDEFLDANSSLNSTNSLEIPSSDLNDSNGNIIEPMNNVFNDSTGSLTGRKQSESWCSLPINELTKIKFGSEHENGSWNGFYIFRKNNEFKNILKRVKDYMMKKQPSPLTSIKPFKIGHNFIIKQDNNLFVRAKLVKIHMSSNLNNMYQLLLVDMGTILYVTDSAIKRDKKIYDSSNELACAAIPYQTIYCKLAGIVMNSNRICVKVKSKHIYVVAKRQYQSFPLKDMGIQGYEVILYECDYEDDLSGGLMFNQHLIDSGVAHYDEQTQTDLDIDLTKNMDPNKSVMLLEQCLKNMMDFEKDATKDFFKQLFGLKVDEDGDDNELESTGKPNKRTGHLDTEQLNIKDEQLSKKNKSETSKMKPIVSETIYPTRYPQVTWYQNSAIINISVEVPDSSNYVVDCNGTELFYATEPTDDEPISQLFHIYLCGYVKQFSHEKRGLHVVIKLRKEMCELWPSLIEVNDNDPLFQLPFIKYNLEHVEIASEKLSHVQETQLALSRIEAGLYKNSSLDDKDLMQDEDSDVDADNETESENNEYFINNKTRVSPF